MLALGWLVARPHGRLNYRFLLVLLLFFFLPLEHCGNCDNFLVLLNKNCCFDNIIWQTTMLAMRWLVARPLGRLYHILYRIIYISHKSVSPIYSTQSGTIRYSRTHDRLWQANWLTFRNFRNSCRSSWKEFLSRIPERILSKISCRNSSQEFLSAPILANFL